MSDQRAAPSLAVENVRDLGFEASIRRLGEIVEKLEDGELPLEESLKLFEEGVLLARTSREVLDKAEQRVEELLRIDESGNPVTRAMVVDEDE
jgi:exodeoxyribonuclease VII small subunit